MKKLYTEPRAQLLLLLSDLLLASDEEEGFPGWNGGEIVLPPMPLSTN